MPHDEMWAGSDASCLPNCPVCGSPGLVAYRDLEDRLFEAPGAWTMRRCSREGCGLLWLDPRPTSNEVAKAYQKYYTHEAEHEVKASSPLKRGVNAARKGYISWKFGYAATHWQRWLGRIAALLPIRPSEFDADVRCLERVEGGCVLDIGCGSGDWLVAMKNRGWAVEGLDFDQAAVEVARRRGVRVRVGQVEEQGYPPASFDAVTLNHVIEHVPDPVRTLRECWRILKPGGKLVLFTPNAASVSRRWFGASWRGLEPPRHLQIFSAGAISATLARSGCQRIEARSFVVTSVLFDSLTLALGGQPLRSPVARGALRVLCAVLKCGEWIWLLRRPAEGDCLSVTARKAPHEPVGAREGS